MRWQPWLVSTSLACIAPGESAASEPGPGGAQALRAASSSSPRPSECRPSGSDWPILRVTVWDRARQPRLARYCDALARGYARLSSDPAAALLAASLAAQAEPRRAAPRLLEARALLEQGRQSEALATYKELLQARPELRLTPDARYAYARALAGSGERQAALDVYRRVVPMAELALPGSSEVIYLEAALLVMLADPGELQEAVAYLNEARRRNAAPALRPFVLAALALALDRQGRGEEARGVASEARGRTAAMLSQLEASGVAARAHVVPRLDRLELLPMVAILLAEDEPETARQYWHEFSEQAPANHPWLGHARAKLLAKGKRGP